MLTLPPTLPLSAYVLSPPDTLTDAPERSSDTPTDIDTSPARPFIKLSPLPIRTDPDDPDDTDPLAILTPPLIAREALEEDDADIDDVDIDTPESPTSDTEPPGEAPLPKPDEIDTDPPTPDPDPADTDIEPPILSDDSLDPTDNTMLPVEVDVPRPSPVLNNIDPDAPIMDEPDINDKDPDDPS